MNKFIISALLVVAFSANAFAQKFTYAVHFKDKGQHKNMEQAARLALSEYSINKKTERHIPLTVSDLPVNADYLQQLTQQDIDILLTSRWMNLAIISTNMEQEALLQQFSFISGVKELTNTSPSTVNLSARKLNAANNEPATTAVDYGNTQAQIALMNLDCLHNKGYQGTGSLVAVFDTGFLGVDTISAFDSIRLQNRFIATRNFVNPAQSVYSTDLHGTMVFSTMAGNRPGNFVGAAVNASYALAITENLGTETHQEEYNWLAAAEWADSMGADVIQSSLSYKYFDAGQGDYTEAQLDGKTAIITNAARMAASKGIIVVNSAGNDGTLPPPMSKKISPPCDADSILAVGSVDANGLYHDISSIGNTADGRLKPDVVAMGRNTWILNNRGTALQNSGTSFAAPLISGLVACLKQANPQRSYWEIMRAVTVSANRLNNPDVYYGYGIPDACKADSLLKTYNSVNEPSFSLKNKLLLFPNPSSDFTTLTSVDPSVKIAEVNLHAVNGQLIQHLAASSAFETSIDLRSLASGIYLVEVKTTTGLASVLKLVKE